MLLQGKVGEKLEKRREQNRRAAATYREKQRRKKLSVEQVAKVSTLSSLLALIHSSSINDRPLPHYIIFGYYGYNQPQLMIRLRSYDVY